MGMLCEATEWTACQTVVWEQPVLWSEKGRQGASVSSWQALGVREVGEDVNKVVVHWSKLSKELVMEWDLRAEQRGPECFDVYIVPKGEIKSRQREPSNGTPWVRIGVINKAVSEHGRDGGRGEVWYKGGALAWHTIEWSKLRAGWGVDWLVTAESEADQGVSMYTVVAKELIGSGHAILGLQGEADARTR